jgi:hypothetical protein
VVEHRFDQLTKHLTRRRMAKGLLAGGTAGIVALVRSALSKADRCLIDVEQGCAAEHAAECARRCAESARYIHEPCACLDFCFHVSCGSG